MKIQHRISKLGVVSLSTTIDDQLHSHWDVKLVKEERWQALRRTRTEFRKRLREKGVIQ